MLITITTTTTTEDKKTMTDTSDMTTTTTTTTTRTHGYVAIELSERLDLRPSKYCDPTEPAREGLSIEEARDIAAIDPQLIYLDVPTHTLTLALNAHRDEEVA